MLVEKRSIKTIATLLPYLLLLVSGLGLGLTIILHRPDLTMASLIYVIPLILAAIILLLNKNANLGKLAWPSLAKGLHFPHLFLINILIFIISLIMLVSSVTRPLAYFILVSLFSGIILWQILVRRPAWTTTLIVIEIMLISLNLIWGVSLKYPLYFADTDTLGHLRLIDVILKTSHSQTYLVYYLNYPLYHMFNAIGIEITGLSIRTSLFIFMGLAWQAMLLLGFFVFRDLTNSSKFAAIASLLFGSSSQLIFYGSYAIARSLAFVFFMGWIYLIINKASRDNRYLLLSVILMVAMIMTHQINVILTIPLLILVYLCQKLVNRSQADYPIGLLFIYLFSVCTISYLVWFAPSLADSNLAGTTRSLFSENVNIRGDVTEGYGFSVIVGAIYYIFVLLLCFLGVRVLFEHFKFNTAKPITGAFALAGLFLLVVYVPGPLDLFPQSRTLMISRFNLIVSPFIVFLMVFGIHYITSYKAIYGTDRIRMLVLPVLSVGLVSLMTFFSAISTGNAQDCDYFPHTATIDTPYFTDSELSSFTFLYDYADSTLPLYADFQTMRNEFILNNFPVKRIITGGDINYITHGYITLRKAELKRKTALTFSINQIDTYRYHIDPASPSTDFLSNLSSTDRIYANNGNEIFIVSNKKTIAGESLGNK
jgi:uncharacterized membrane protein